MSLLGQASGGFTESSSSLRILHLGIRNTVGVLSDDAFTQSNPPVIAANASAQLGPLANVLGVLGGSIAFTRGANIIGGPDAGEVSCAPLGVFINGANGNSFENTPGAASGKGPYVSGQGTYGNAIFETAVLAGGNAGNDVTYAAGASLVASLNGYLTASAEADDSFELDAGAAASTTIGILKMPADAAQDEIVYDQRV